MKRYMPVFAAFGVSLISSALVPSLKADEWDLKTIITISQPVAVQGTILPTGQYVLKLQDNTSSRDVVRIFNGDETQLIATIFAIPTERQKPTDQSVFSFYDSSITGETAALHTWFYPGASTGFEFLQPHSTLFARSGAAPGATKKTTQSPRPAAPANSSEAGG